MSQGPRVRGPRVPSQSQFYAKPAFERDFIHLHIWVSEANLLKCREILLQYIGIG